MSRKTRKRNLVGIAEETLRAELANGPQRTTAVKAAAGVEIPAETWRNARVRVGAIAERIDGRWYWCLPGDDLEHAFGAWLATPAGRFAEYLAQRDRPRRGEQLRLV